MDKNNFVTNPNTGRAVKIGGRMYNILIKKGLIEPIPIDEYDDNVLNNIDDIPDDNLNDIKQEYNEKLPKEYHAVKGRGKYKGKLVKRSKPIKKVSSKNRQYDVQHARDTIINNLDSYDDNSTKLIKQSIDDGTLEDYIDQILNEKINKKTSSKSHIKKSKKYKYDDSDSDDDDDEFNYTDDTDSDDF